MADFQPLINGTSYYWGSITCNIMSVPIVGITSINYKISQKMNNVYGAGSQPVSRGYGNKTPTASITLLMEEVQALVAASPTGLLSDIPEFDIQITYVDPRFNLVTHRLRNARFTNNEVTVKQGDDMIEVPLELLISHIEWK